ncbi:MFS transporter [Jiangella alkaliphila]|uniref:Predicted arabinose efflux permease, MFS family n=1 Tax=Jiangella alkaliphila TaxID=419479 RepID=A0A1H2JHT1_9ACTN|nr:MFS transporter [Jiangella alkaliphila]SDU55625.1 Predicted arabinose efflux permease, MFS family [Jiangella alkaliphila]
MTTATIALAPATAALDAPLISRALLLRFVTIIGSSLGFYLPLSVVPMVAEAAGSAGTAGLATGALLVASIAGEVATPRLVARFGYRFALTAGLVLLGAPTLLLLASSDLAVIVGVNLVRGLGFGVTIVAGGALTAALLPEHRRGEGLALVGVVGGVPALVALPFGVWAAGQWGAGTVFAITAAATLLCLVAVPGLPRRTGSGGGSHGVLAGLRDAGLVRPAAVFAASTVAIGVLVTFLPLATGSASVAAAALLVQPATSTATRWVAGRLGDRYGQGRLLVPGLVLSGLGLLGVTATGVPAAVIAGAGVFGAGFGVLQNATLALMYTRVRPEGYGTVSAIWNAAYDIGMAVGATGAGLIAAGAGYPVVFALTAALLIPALLPARRESSVRA